MEKKFKYYSFVVRVFLIKILLKLADIFGRLPKVDKSKCGEERKNIPLCYYSSEKIILSSKDLDYDYVDSQEKYDELKKQHGKDIMNSAEGFFEVMEDGKRKIFINRDVAAMQSATNVIGH